MDALIEEAANVIIAWSDDKDDERGLSEVTDEHIVDGVLVKMARDFLQLRSEVSRLAADRERLIDALDRIRDAALEGDHMILQYIDDALAIDAAGGAGT